MIIKPPNIKPTTPVIGMPRQHTPAEVIRAQRRAVKLVERVCGWRINARVDGTRPRTAAAPLVRAPVVVATMGLFRGCQRSAHEREHLPPAGGVELVRAQDEVHGLVGLTIVKRYSRAT